MWIMKEEFHATVIVVVKLNVSVLTTATWGQYSSVWFVLQHWFAHCSDCVFHPHIIVDQFSLQV